MNIEASSIKEISLVTDTQVYGPTKGYNDLMRVSKHRISYQRNDIVMWDFLDNSIDMKISFDNLVSKVIEFAKGDHYKNLNEVTDIGSFNLRITFTDNRHMDYHGSGDLYFAYNEYLIDIAKTLFLMAPNGCITSIFINPIACTVKQLEAKCLELNYEKPVDVNYIMTDSMGNTELIVNGNNFIPVHLFDEKLITNFNFKQPNSDLIFNDIGLAQAEVNGNEMVYIYLGHHNELYIDRDLHYSYFSKIFNPKPELRYRNWKMIFHQDEYDIELFDK